MKEVLNTPSKDVNSSSLASNNTAILDNVDSWDIINFAQPFDSELLTDVIDVTFGADEGSISINNNCKEDGNNSQEEPIAGQNFSEDVRNINIQAIDKPVDADVTGSVISDHWPFDCKRLNGNHFERMTVKSVRYKREFGAAVDGCEYVVRYYVNKYVIFTLPTIMYNNRLMIFIFIGIWSFPGLTPRQKLNIL